MVRPKPKGPTLLRLQINGPGVLGTLLDVSIIGTRLIFQKMPKASDLATYPRSCTVSVSGEKITPMNWTVETFAGIRSSPGNLQSTIDDKAQICEIQFSQRCIFSSTGYATWRLRLCNTALAGCNSPLSYNLTSEANFGLGNPMVPMSILLDGSPIEFTLFNDVNAPGNQQRFQFFSGSTDATVKAAIEPSSLGQLCYKVNDWLPPSGRTLQVGNGIYLANDQDGRNLTLWQSCVYAIDPSNRRSLIAGVQGITTANILNSWNSNIAHRYHEGLPVDKLFSAVPEIEASQDPLPRWTIEFSLTDTYKAFSTKSDTWFVRDSDRESDDIYSVSSVHAGIEPLECIASRVRYVRIRDILQRSFEVKATLPMFKTQDGLPVTAHDQPEFLVQ